MHVKLIINEQQWEDLLRRCQGIPGEVITHVDELPGMSLDYVPSKGDWIYFHVLANDRISSFPVSAQIQDVAHWLCPEKGYADQIDLFLRIGKLAPCNPLNPFEAFKP